MGKVCPPTPIPATIINSTVPYLIPIRKTLSELPPCAYPKPTAGNTQISQHAHAEPGFVLSILIKIGCQKENKIKQIARRHHQCVGIDPQDKMCQIKVKTSQGALRSFVLKEHSDHS